MNKEKVLELLVIVYIQQIKEKREEKKVNKKKEENIYQIIRKEFKVVEEIFGIKIPEIEYDDIVDLFKIHFDTQK